MRIKVKNFQCIKDIDLSLNGIVVVTGDNGSGKSALFRAINKSIQNRISVDRDILWGESECKITFEFDNGYFAEIIKGKKSNKIFTSSGCYDKIGKDAIEEVDKNFPIKSIRGININMVGFNEEIFPFNLNPGDLYQIYYEFFGVGKIQKLIDDEKVSKKNLQNEMVKMGGKIDQVSLDLKDIDEKISKYPDKKVLKGVIQNISLYEGDLDFLNEKVTILKKLKSDIKLINDRLLILNGILIKDNIEWRFNNLSMRIEEGRDIFKILKEIKDAKEKLNLNNERVDILEKVLNKININRVSGYIVECEEIRKIYDDILKNLSKVDLIKSRVDEINYSLDKTVWVGNFEKEIELLGKLKEVIDINLKVKGVDEKLRVVIGELESNFNELKKIDICPVCGRSGWVHTEEGI